MGYIRKIKGSLVRQDSSVYVGEETYLFYDIDTGCIRRSDGTPGGAQIGVDGCFGGAGGGGGVVVEDTFGDFPQPGEDEIIYIDASTDTMYRWDTTIPNYVVLTPGGLTGSDNVKEYPTLGDFPPIGESDVIYIDATTDLLYRWDGSTYVQVGASDPNDHDFTSGTVTPGNTNVIYTEYPSANLTLKFVISILDTIDGRFASAEVLAAYKDLDTSVNHTHYAKIGDNLDYRCLVEVNGAGVELQIQNNDVNSLDINVTRVPTISI